jgi:hypothetical protein
LRSSFFCGCGSLENRPQAAGNQEARDPHPWRGSLALGVIFTALFMGFSLNVAWLYGTGWFVPQDIWFLVRGSHYVADGALGYVYEAADYVYALPLFHIFIAPVVLIGDAFQLSEWIPYRIPYPTLWLVLAPYCLLSATIFGTYSIRDLAIRLNIRGSKLLMQIAFVVVVVLPCALLGHFEDVLAIGFIALALRSVINTRYEMAALLLSLALGFKHWAFLGVPAFVALVPRGSRFRFLVFALALPLSLAGFTLIADWEHASEALFSSPTFPKLGHSVPWLDPRADEAGTVVYRIITIAVAGAVALRLWSRTTPELALAGLGVVFLARPILEPVPHIYYLAPGLALLLLLERFTTGRQIRTLFVGLPLLAWFAFTPGQTLWWIAFAVGWIVLAFPSIRAIIGGAGARIRDREDILEDPVRRVSHERYGYSSPALLPAGSSNSASVRSARRKAGRDHRDPTGTHGGQSWSPVGGDPRGRAGYR